MRKIILLLFCLITYNTVFSQNTTGELKLKSGYLNFHYTVNDEDIDEEEIDSIMIHCNKSAELYWKSMTKNTINATACALGTFMAGFGVITFILEERAKPSGESNPLLDDVNFWVITGTGVALLSATIPLHISAKKDAQQAVDMYNNRHSTTFKKSERNLFLSISPMKIGFNYKF